VHVLDLALPIGDDLSKANGPPVYLSEENDLPVYLSRS
jgi:hypothetical protein